MTEPEHPFEPPAAADGRGSPEPEARTWLQPRLVLLGVLVSFLAELVVTAGAAIAYIGTRYSDLLEEPELIFWQIMDSPFLRMVSALSGLPATMLGGFVAARKALARPRAHAVLVAVVYATLLTLVAELLLARTADSGSDYVAYATTVSGTIVGGLLGGVFAARGRRG